MQLHVCFAVLTKCCYVLQALRKSLLKAYTDNGGKYHGSDADLQRQARKRKRKSKKPVVDKESSDEEDFEDSFD